MTLCQILSKTTVGLAAAVSLFVSIGGAYAASGSAAHGLQDRQRGSVIRIDSLNAVDQAQLQGIAAEFPGSIRVQNGTRLFRIIYWTVLKDTPTQASGLLAIPQSTSPAKGVVLYLHGTNATRALAPSQPGRIDGNEEAAVFAGNGYIVVLPDYIGLGVSRMPQPYLIVQPQVDASLDLLRAVRSAFAIGRAGSRSNLFMMGFSQGGQVVAGLHRALERQPLPGYRLKGSIGIAGPYDLYSASLPKAIENQCRQCVGYLTWGVYAYATYYGHPLGQALKSRYVGVVPTLFDGSKTATEIGTALPDNPEDMFQPQFLATMRSAGDNWFTRALARNETYAWVPTAPFRLYFGDSDVDVSPSASSAFFNYAKPRGGNISLHPLAHADHQASASLTYAPALKWFDVLTRSQ